MTVSDKTALLRREMEREGIDIYIVPTSDFHQSEYVGDYFKAREFLTGFTGSAGTAVFTREKAGLWTDGRYFLQAEEQLRGTGIELYRMGEPGVETIPEFLARELPCGGCLGFDGRTVGNAEGKEYEAAVEQKSGRIVWEYDLADRIWKDRPPLSSEPAYLLDIAQTGESAASKLGRLREKMKEEGADAHVISSLDDIAWLFNIRGNDIRYCPLVLSYAIITQDQAVLFADPRKFDGDVKEALEKVNAAVRPYGEIYDAVRKIASGSVLLDPERTSYAMYHAVPAGCRILEAQNPCVLMKCIKNDTEAENIRQAHIKDGIAHTRFMYWLKKNIGKIPITEISAAEQLRKFRAEQDGFLGESFEPICAFGPHGAVVHYSATDETDAVLREGSLFLTDTGGHYREGSTDITRTVALGDIPQEQKEHFTLVARAMLRLADTVFLHGCSGATLDCAARQVLWKKRLNFNHGTGHGVGYLLNIHEAPINFRWKEGKAPAQVFEKNMVISDEPGIYIAGSHGIRLENLLLVREDEKNEYGQFMKFETLTLVPLDLDALCPEQMTEEEREVLNAYHRRVRNVIGPHLCLEERRWLEEYTRPV